MIQNRRISWLRVLVLTNPSLYCLLTCSNSIAIFLLIYLFILCLFSPSSLYPACTLLVPCLYPGSVSDNRGNWPPHKGVCIKNSAARHTCLNVNSYISTCMQASRCISIYLPSMSDVHIILLPHKNALRLQNVKNNHMLHFGTRLC